MLRRAQMSDIWSPSGFGSGDPDTSIFILYINGREPINHELWSHRLYRLSRDFRPTAQVEIPT